MLASESSGVTTNSLDNYKQSIAVLEKIVANYPTNRIAPMAWGMMGICYFQRASANPAFYATAASAYSNAMTLVQADVATRSQAEMGIARLLEKQAEQAPVAERAALFNQALAHYFNVVEGKNLRDNEEAAPFWVKESAVAAAHLAEDQREWDVARSLYERLKNLVPALQATWDARLERLKQLRVESGAASADSRK